MNFEFAKLPGFRALLDYVLYVPCLRASKLYVPTCL